MRFPDFPDHLRMRSRNGLSSAVSKGTAAKIENTSEWELCAVWSSDLVVQMRPANLPFLRAPSSASRKYGPIFWDKGWAVYAVT